jgi:hypothetical protein
VGAERGCWNCLCFDGNGGRVAINCCDEKVDHNGGIGMGLWCVFLQECDALGMATTQEYSGTVVSLLQRIDHGFDGRIGKVQYESA